MKRDATAPAAPPPGTAPGANGRRAVYLHPGEIVASATPAAVTTILGSCVAVCLHDPVARIGGVNHFLLPHHVAREASSRFGNVAIPKLVEEMVRAGARRGSLVAKVFGGASVHAAARRSRGRHLGEENAILALRLLLDAGIPVLDHDVGGGRGRKLVFLTDEGTAWVKHL